MSKITIQRELVKQLELVIKHTNKASDIQELSALLTAYANIISAMALNRNLGPEEIEIWRDV